MRLLIISLVILLGLFFPVSIPAAFGKTDQTIASAVKPMVAAGSYHSVALKSDGTVVVSSRDVSGQSGGASAMSAVRIPDFMGVIAVAAGYNHTVALKSDGTLVAWGSNGRGQLGDGTTTDRLNPVAVPGLGGVAAIAAGTVHTVALKSDGTVVEWGDNSTGPLSAGSTNLVAVPGLTGVVAIAAGSAHVVALKSDGTVVAWGDNFFGQLGDGTMGKRSNPVPVPGLGGVVAIAAGTAHTVALKSDGTVVAWGSNFTGQLGDGTMVGSTSPVAVSGLTGVVAIAAGSAYTVAIKSDGTVVAWGDNQAGQLGDGTTANHSNPVTVPGLSGVVEVAAAGYSGSHTLALKFDGTAVAWGNNFAGQLGDGTTTSHLSPVAMQGLPGETGQARISFSPTVLIMGGTSTAGAIASSGLAVSFTTLTPGICTVIGSTVTGIAEGTCIIAANQAGDANYNAAPQVTQSINIGKVDQAVSLGAVPIIIAGGSGTVSATATSGLAVSFSSATPSVCIVSGNIVTGVAPGNCSIFADQAGDAIYKAAPQVMQNINIGKVDQTVSFGAVPRVDVGGSGSVMATATSGLAASFSSMTPSVCTVSGNTVTGVAFGNCIITADQAGDFTYNAAPQVTQNIAIKLGQTIGAISFMPSMPSVGISRVSATATSGLAVSFSSTTPSVCVVSGSTITSSRAGFCTIAADQAGDGTYNAAVQNLKSIYIAKADQSVSFGTAPTIAVGETGIVSAAATSGFAVYLTSSTPDICTVSGSYVMGVAAGNCIVVAGQVGDDHSYNAASQVTQLIAISASALPAAPPQIFAGGTLAVKSDGSLWAWGDNMSGAVGNGSLVNQTSPVQIGTGFVTGATNGTYSAAIKSDGSLWMWGGIYLGQLGDGTTTQQNSPVQIGAGYKAISVGGGHTLAVKTDGSLWAWSRNYYGELGNGTVTPLPPMMGSQPDKLDAAPVMVGADFSSAVATDRNSYAIKSDGSLWAWGGNDSGQMGIGKIDACMMNACPVYPIPVMIGTGVKAVAAGGRFVAAILKDGSLWTWGNNNHGQLGDGTTTDRYSPVQIGTGFRSVAAGVWHTAAIKSDGSLWVWGYNSSGELGDGTTIDSYSPVQIGTGFVDVAAGATHTIATKADGSLWAWGDNSRGAVGAGPVPFGVSSSILTPVEIATGFRVAPQQSAASTYTFPTFDYAPLILGNSWTATQDGVVITDTVLSGPSYYDGMKFAVQENNGDISYVSNDSNGIREMGSFTQNATVPNSGSANLNVTYDPPIIDLPAEATLGQTISSHGTATLAYTTGFGAFIPYKLQSTPVIFESVTVPAGTFDALRVQQQLTLSGTINAQPIHSSTTQTLWVVPKVGTVKRIGSETTNGVTRNLSYVLNSYNLVAPVTAPNPFSLAPKRDVIPGTLTEAAEFTVTGINTYSPISIAGGEYRTNYSPYYTSAPGLVRAGDRVTVRQVAPSNLGMTSSAILNIGGVSASFDASTMQSNPTGNLLYYTSQVGDRVGQGMTELLSSASQYTISLYRVSAESTSSQVNFSIRQGKGDWYWDWRLSFRSPVNTALTVGSYEVAENFSYPPPTGVPGMDLYGNGVGGCYSSGRFDVLEAVYDTTGNIVQFAVNFEHHCDGMKPALFGQLRYNSTIPVELALLGAGWNLAGNSLNAPINVVSTFGNASNVSTVWKWMPATSKWAFYAPSQTDGGAAYAATKGYDFLTTIGAGEGFWVNAKQPYVWAKPLGNPITANSFQTTLAPGWNLVSTGENKTPSQFNAALGATQPATGIPQNLTTLWTWDNALSNWYFYAPSLEAQGGTALTDYIANKGYLDFTANNKTLGPGMGFWVNRQ